VAVMGRSQPPSKTTINQAPAVERDELFTIQKQQTTQYHKDVLAARMVQIGDG